MRTRALLPLAILSALAACAAPKPVTPPPVVATLAPPPPEMPVGGYLGMAIPARLADGRYPTPNIDVTAAAAVWHLRGALNVAALACDVADGPYVTAYNSWIRARAAVLGAYGRRYTSEWEDGTPGDWRDAYDDQQTRLYNFYTQPAIKAAFCAAALDEVRAVEAVPDAELPAFARASLARLDRPFTDFYAAFDRFRDHHAGAPTTPTASPVMVATDDAAAPPLLAVAPEIFD